VRAVASARPRPLDPQFTPLGSTTIALQIGRDRIYEPYALFRGRDQQSMKFAFDLWSYDDVKANAQAILGRLDNGTMPCDGAWPREQIAAFKRWLQSGMSP
jgi:hypothetical protein